MAGSKLQRKTNPLREGRKPKSEFTFEASLALTFTCRLDEFGFQLASTTRESPHINFKCILSLQSFALMTDLFS